MYRLLLLLLPVFTCTMSAVCLPVRCPLCVENARWLMLFANHPATHWDGLCLSPTVVASKRQLLRRGAASLIDLRNYLFSRQCHVLLQLQRPAEICHRSMPFVHNCIKELRILQVNIHPVISLFHVYLPVKSINVPMQLFKGHLSGTVQGSQYQNCQKH